MFCGIFCIASGFIFEGVKSILSMFSSSVNAFVNNSAVINPCSIRISPILLPVPPW